MAIDYVYFYSIEFAKLIIRYPSFLLCRHGEETARKFVSTYSYRHYKDRADEIREEVLKWQR